MLEIPGTTELLRDRGLRGLPVVSRGDEFVYGVDLAAVAALVGGSYDATPVLGAAELAARYRRILDATLRFARQIPAERLDDELPHRPRSYLTLVNHVVQIAVDFMAVSNGATLTGRLAASLPEQNATIDALAERVGAVQQQIVAFAHDATSTDLGRTVETYFGAQTLHQVFERAVWHSAQHARQLMMVLQTLGVEPRAPLTAADFDDLPMPDDVWDG